MKTYMAIDQYGEELHDLGPFPRKGLLTRLGATKASRMYVDGKDGKRYHVGYVVGSHWFNLYEVIPMRRAV